VSKEWPPIDPRLDSPTANWGNDDPLPDEEPHYSCTQAHCAEDDPANCWARQRLFPIPFVEQIADAIQRWDSDRLLTAEQSLELAHTIVRGLRVSFQEDA